MTRFAAPIAEQIWDMKYRLRDADGTRLTLKVNGVYRVAGGVEELRAQLKAICEQVSAAVNRGVEYVVLSDRGATAQWAPIPSLLLTSAVHHHLLASANRTKSSLIVEAGDVREVHHVAVLLGYGASAVNPYLAMESAEELVRTGEVSGVTAEQAVANLIKALGKGVQKIMSKMGISTVASYTGAQTFEALGLSRRFADRYFVGTTSPLDGVGIDVVAAEIQARHEFAYPPDGNDINPYRELEVGGEYQWRREGAPHLFNPETVFRLQHSTRERRYDVFKDYTRRVDDQAEELMTLRGLMRLRTGERPPVPVSEVEPVESIVRRFSTGAMSYGSISQEAHETLAIAMNRLGARSNSGEGGEDPERLLDPERRSKIKQIASGRFGVTSLYLATATDLQIKMAQGAKPGEGGQLMGTKVYPWVARTRHSTPGVSLVSPPPHHDIYSIEDLAQLIHDLKRANPTARVHVKLVSESGVGTVAAGVAKARADVVLISGHDGGTGASPLNSLKHAGTPWEIGLAEAQQTLMLNGLRERVKLTPGIPLKPMLAKPTKEIGEVLDRFENRTFTCEYKYDGERAQVHGFRDAAGKLNVRVFSRNSEDMSMKYPDLVVQVPRCLGEDVQSFVIDAEAVAWQPLHVARAERPDASVGRLLPFQELSRRKRKDVKAEDIKVFVKLFGFDLLYLNGEPLLHLALSERRAKLFAHFVPVADEFDFATRRDCHTTEEIQTFLDESVASGCEGLMVKMLDGADATYEPSRRSINWLKLKKDYCTPHDSPSVRHGRQPRSDRNRRLLRQGQAHQRVRCLPPCVLCVCCC